MKSTVFREITQNNDHYAVQSHPRSLILVPIESTYTTSYYWLIVTYLLSCILYKLPLIICQILNRNRTRLHFNALAGGDTLRISCMWYTAKTRFFWLHSTRRMCRCIFNHFYLIRPQSYRICEITQITWPLRCSRSFKVTDFGTNGSPYATSY